MRSGFVYNDMWIGGMRMYGIKKVFGANIFFSGNDAWWVRRKLKNVVWSVAEAARKDMIVPVSLRTADKRSGLLVARRNAIG